MAGTFTVTYDEGFDGEGIQRGLKKILVDWVSDASAGNVVITTRKIVGELIKLVTDPGATAPTDNYDVVITDEEGVDVLAACVTTGRAADRDTANSEQVYFFVENLDASPLASSVHPVVCDALTITISNAGNSKVGQLILYYRPG